MMQGDPYHAGHTVLEGADWRAPYDTALARRFLAAGVVVVGRTNTPEFGSTVTTEPLAYGPSRNPWNRTHSTGGSSGGRPRLSPSAWSRWPTPTTAAGRSGSRPASAAWSG